MRPFFLRRLSKSCLCIAASALIAPHAFAMNCPSPAPLLPNAKVNVIYDPSDSSMKACVGSTWITLSGSGGGGGALNDLTDVVISSPTANQALVYNGASWTNMALTVSESDPQVGTLTANKWCATNAGGTAIDCTQDAPSLVESDPTIGTLTNGKWCSTDGSVVSCVQDAPVASAGADTQVIFNSSGTLTGDASLVWDNNNKRLGIGTATPLENFHVAGSASGNVTTRISNSGTGSARLRLVGNNGTEDFVLFTATDRLAVWDGSSEVLSIKEGGNVGIGTASPAQKLDVSDGTLSIFQVDTATQSWKSGGNNLVIDATKSGAATVLKLQGTERLRVTPAGNIGIGTTTPQLPLEVIRGSDTWTAMFGGTAGGNRVMIGTLGGAASIGGNNANASAWVNLDLWGSTVVTHNVSDERLKINIHDLPFSFGLEAISKLRTVSFEWKDVEQRKDGGQIGLIAQEAQKVLPNIVEVAPKGTTINLEDGSTEKISDMLTVNYEGLIIPLVKSVQELKEANDDLRATVEAQGREIEQLKAKPSTASRTLPH